jgi:hypothetical protein
MASFGYRRSSASNNFNRCPQSTSSLALRQTKKKNMRRISSLHSNRSQTKGSKKRVEGKRQTMIVCEYCHEEMRDLLRLNTQIPT